MDTVDYLNRENILEMNYRVSSIYLTANHNKNSYLKTEFINCVLKLNKDSLLFFYLN